VKKQNWSLEANQSLKELWKDAVSSHLKFPKDCAELIKEIYSLVKIERAQAKHLTASKDCARGLSKQITA